MTNRTDSRQHDIAYEDHKTAPPGDDKDDLSPREQLWLQRSARAYADSTDYYESSLYDNWRKNVSHFRNLHAPGSKYSTLPFKHRSKVFRPKTRAVERSREAALAMALFTNNDVVDVRGVNSADEMQATSAKLLKPILQHRLETTIPWLTTAIGAYQDTGVYGICISKQYWNYHRVVKTNVEEAFDEAGEPIFDEETGLQMGYDVEEEEILSDTPVVDILAPDNFRFDPNCDWRDPISSSPYLIELMPMYAVDVQAMMIKGEDGKTEQPEWIYYTLNQIVTAGHQRAEEGNTVRHAREEGREDPVDIEVQKQYTTVWVHFNIMRDEDGTDVAFYTLGERLLLSEPVPLSEIYRQKRELYRVGISSIEAHRPFPAGTVELSRPLQEEINSIANQRRDNVSLILNKRWGIKRGADVDLGALMRNVPGGGVMMNDPQTDIKLFDTPDVTKSSYTEHDRLNMEFDDLVGSFSQATVQANRQLHETVGGMQMMNAGASQINDLDITVFIHTWVLPVLRTVLKLESWYETDETILALAAEKAQFFEEISDELMDQNLVVKVNVGMNNTDPMRKIQNLSLGMQALQNVPSVLARLKEEEIAKDILAAIGWGDGQRMLLTDDELKEKQKEMPPQQDPTIMIAQMNQELKMTEIEARMGLEQAKLEQEGELAVMKMEDTQQLAYAKIAAEENMGMAQLYETLGLKREEIDAKYGSRLEELKLKRSDIQAKRDIAAARQVGLTRELNNKIETGQEGI